MCDNPGLVVLKSNSAGNLLLSSEMTLIPSSAESSSADPSTGPSSNELPNNNNSKLRRTFTLPRNPFNSTRMSSTKRRTTSISTSTKNKDYSLNTNSNETEMNEADKTTNNNNNNKKVFRRPSLRKFINRIAQHIGGVPGVIANTATDDNNRVPPLGGLQTWGPEDTPGVTGLKNHGNTCFINAVLQCISHTDVLAEYFVLDRYKIDLSRRNKLNSKKFGTKGEVTEQLALLLKALWSCQYSPDLSTSFKQVVERHGAQYKGNQQHDALEFLQWLLDKVHEDLNTASKRKYKSIKTSGRPDEVIAAETLENYKRCNNSFIQGIFQAQYRSSLSCSRCRNQSNTFDPFQCISVQLPQFTKQSIYVTVLYTSQQPRQVQIGLSMPSGATISELRDILESDTSIERANMLITEIGESGFLRTFTDTQVVNIISEIDPIYCIEVAQLKDPAEDDDSSTTTSAYVLLCWINVIVTEKDIQRFGSPYTMQVSRETSYEDLQKLILKEMAPILHDDVLTSSQPKGIFKIRISDPACNDNEPPCYLEPDLEHPLFTEAVDQALALCSEEGGPPHVKLVMEFAPAARTALIADDTDLVEVHSSVKQLRVQAVMHGGSGGGGGGGGPPLTLEECLRDYTEAETLTDAWRCPNCQQYQPVVKTLDMWSLPDILVVHFKRFRQQTLRGCNNSAKLTTMVDFPVYNLDMTPHLAKKHHQQHNHHGNNHNNSTNLNHHHNNHHHHHHSSHTNVDDASQMIMHQQQLNGGGGGWSPWKRTRKQSNASDNVYDLYAICYHHGSDIETGHYTAACKNPYDQQWYLYDDAKVTNLSKQTEDIATELVNNSAYILFYQKRNGTLYINNGSYSNGSYGSSSNSASSTTSSGTGSASNSSAASTSSVGSSSVATSTNSGDSGYAPLRDHWVSRMPKFVPPSCANNTSNANGGNCNTNNSNNNSTNNNKNNTLRRGQQQQQQDCAQQTKKENDDVSNNKQNNGCVKEDSVTENQHGDCQLLSSSAATTDKDDDDSNSLTAQDTKVALRNSQNTLHSSQTSVLRKSLEHKSTNTNLDPVNNSQATSSSTNNLTNSQSPKNHNNHYNANRQSNEKSATFCQNPTSDVIDGKKTLYTTSIYIDSCGDANISTKSTDRNFSDVVDDDNDDVMSTTTNQRPLRLGTSKGAVAVDNVDEPMTNGTESNTNTNTPTTTNEVLRRTYTTTAAVHRYSDVNSYYCNSISDRSYVSKTHLNWMSPQPLRKLNQSQQSM